MRNAGPVLYGDDWYYLTRREDVIAALRNPDVFSSHRAFDRMVSPVPLVPLAFDPPEQPATAGSCIRFSPATCVGTALAAGAGGRHHRADRRSGRVRGDGRLATPYPSQVFLTLFGLPLEDRERLIEWKYAIIELSLATDPESVDLTPAANLYAYLTDAVKKQRQNPRDGILSQVLTGDESLSDAEAIGLSFVLILAGLDTVMSAIGATMLELARRPALRRELREEPDRIGAYVEEMIRLEPPAPVVGRVTTQPVAVGGVELPAGAQVRLCLGAINRDGSDTTSGDDLVMDGKVHKHWGFGGGVHRCLGAHLARMELNLIVTEWLHRIHISR